MSTGPEFALFDIEASVTDANAARDILFPASPIETVPDAWSGYDSDKVFHLSVYLQAGVKTFTYNTWPGWQPTHIAIQSDNMPVNVGWVLGDNERWVWDPNYDGVYYGMANLRESFLPAGHADEWLSIVIDKGTLEADTETNVEILILGVEDTEEGARSGHKSRR